MEYVVQQSNEYTGKKYDKMVFYYLLFSYGILTKYKKFYTNSKIPIDGKRMCLIIHLPNKKIPVKESYPCNR
jgi:hypothetical protein